LETLFGERCSRELAARIARRAPAHTVLEETPTMKAILIAAIGVAALLVPVVASAHPHHWHHHHMRHHWHHHHMHH